MTEIALIPPVPNLRDFPSTGTCMLLAHLCGNQQYLKFYRERRMLDDYLILDNSAFELGSGANMPFLFSINLYLQCQEVVAPDSIMDQVGTYAESLQATSWLASSVGQSTWKHAGSPRIMVVPQVNPEHDEIDHYAIHAEELMKLWHNNVPYLQDFITLGVSKNMDKLHGSWLMLFREVISQLRRDYPIQVHCLGSPKSLDKTKKVIKGNTYIRSLDTALPFVAALHGTDLTVNGMKAPPMVGKRPEGYLFTEFNQLEVQTAQRNIGYLVDMFKPARVTM